MIPDKLDYTIEKLLNNKLTKAQIHLKQITGNLVKENIAEEVLTKVEVHKWYLSENLGRDVGLQVALLDFYENYYSPNH